MKKDSAQSRNVCQSIRMPVHHLMAIFNSYWVMSVWTNVVVWLCQIVNQQIDSEAHARVEVDWLQLGFSLSLQLQLLSWTPGSSVLQGEGSLLPRQRAGGGWGSAGILLHQLLPVRGHWTVGPASWTHMYTCTAWAVYFHTYHSITSCTIIELLTLKLTLASLLMGEYCLFLLQGS